MYGDSMVTVLENARKNFVLVTMNEDDAFKEQIEGFDLKSYVLPVVLTDAREDGGLFGFRF